MKKFALSLILTLCCAFGLIAANGSVASSEATLTAAAESVGKIDYAGQAVLDENADSQTIEVTVKSFIDGDTTHFYAEGFPQGILKARYVAVDTPESTGQIEEWGKKAASYTRSKLENAVSIIIESEGTAWEYDSTGDRTLSWVWYKAPGENTYCNLNLELLQEGLARPSKAGDTRYGHLCVPAIAQAQELKLYIWSDEKDPDYFYGQSIEVDLKGLRLNVEYYNGKRVAFEGIVSYYMNQGVYVESYDEETQMYWGIYVFYGYSFNGTSILAVGNKVRITGIVSYYETGDSYQISDLKYSKYSPGADDTQLISKGHTVANTETSAIDFNKQVSVGVPNPEDPDAVTTKNFKYSELAMNTSISMNNLTVKSAYTTDNGGNNDGAMTLTCMSSGKTITVRTVVLKDSAGNYATEDMLVGKTINVKGIIDTFNGESQIKILSLAGLLVDGEPLFPPVEPTPPVVDSTSEETSDTASSNVSILGCMSVIAAPALLPVLGVAVVLLKKREN